MIRVKGLVNGHSFDVNQEDKENILSGLRLILAQKQESQTRTNDLEISDLDALITLFERTI